MGTSRPNPLPQTQGEAARALGIAIHTLRNWITQGAPRKTAEGWDVEAIRAWREKTLLPTGRPPGRKRTDDNYREEFERARAEKEALRAKLLDFEVKVQEGKYRSIEEIKQWDCARIAVIRRGLLGLPRAAAPLVVGLDARGVEAVLLKRCKELLVRFSEM